jgi:hypothetical protein
MAMAGRQVIDDRNFETLPQQFFGTDGADISGPPCY